jgi:hypothetical protein
MVSYFEQPPSPQLHDAFQAATTKLILATNRAPAFNISDTPSRSIFQVFFMMEWSRTGTEPPERSPTAAFRPADYVSPSILLCIHLVAARNRSIEVHEVCRVIGE